MDKSDAKILLAEDEPSLRFMVEKQLKVLGYPIPDMANNGLVALQKAIENKYDLIFMDVRMPELDGVESTQQIREHEHSTGVHTTIIGMTAYAHKERCLEAGMDDFLQKPVLLEPLTEMLEKWLKR